MPNRTLKLKEKKLAMSVGGEKLARIRQSLEKAVNPGVKLSYLDKLADDLIKKTGGKPSFKMVPGYDFATCINVNEGVVHGVPGDRRIKKGDLLTIDIGLYFRGYHLDTATSAVAGKASSKQKKFLQAGKKALKKATSKAVTKNHVYDISKQIQKTIEESGYSCTRSLTGHGIGRQLHQEPSIPCIVTGERKNSPKLFSGQTLAIEVIYAEGTSQLTLDNDGWTYSTADKKKAAVFEETILVTNKNPVILTALKKNENNIN